MTAHATLVLRTGLNDRMATLSAAIRALQSKPALRRAAPGIKMLGAARVTLLGEVRASVPLSRTVPCCRPAWHGALP